jgi:23S rRNA (pseudouridine1915-N3)-methyltransferase
MLSIKIICVGKLKEKFYEAAVAEYEKRLRAYCKLELQELSESRLPQSPSRGEIDAALSKEAEDIRKNIPKGAAVIAMCVEGKEYSSPEFSALLEKAAVGGASKLCFVIGGSYGMDESIKKEASYRVSVSQMTFPHHLFRVMLLEQIYRGFKISEGSEYHK